MGRFVSITTPFLVCYFVSGCFLFLRDLGIRKPQLIIIPNLRKEDVVNLQIRFFWK